MAAYIPPTSSNICAHGELDFSRKNDGLIASHYNEKGKHGGEGSREEYLGPAA